MNTRYIDLVNQTFDFPQKEFALQSDNLLFHQIDLMQIIEQYGTPLKFTYLPQISNNIQMAKQWFANAMQKVGYKGKYHYCYCTKSSHFKFVIDDVLKNNVHIETSSAFDIDIVEALKSEGKITDSTYVLCNGFKRDQYITNIVRLINNGHHNCIPIIDNYEELQLLTKEINTKFKVGIRIASEEETKI